MEVDPRRQEDGIGNEMGEGRAVNSEMLLCWFSLWTPGPDPATDPLRNHVAHASELSSQRMGVWRHSFPLMPGYHCVRLAPGVFAVACFQTEEQRDQQTLVLGC